MADTGRTMKMVGFLQAQNCSIAPGSWRHPAAATDFLGPDHYQSGSPACWRRASSTSPSSTTAWRMPDIYGRDHRAAVENGIRAVKMDPVDHPRGDGHGHHAARPRRHLLHDLLRAVPRRPPVRAPWT